MTAAVCQRPESFMEIKEKAEVTEDVSIWDCQACARTRGDVVWEMNEEKQTGVWLFELC